MTVFDSFGTYLEHAHDHLRYRDLVRAARVLWSFASQFGDLPIDEVGEGHVREFVRQPKEGTHGVRYWSPAAQRRAAGIVREALAWAASRAE